MLYHPRQEEGCHAEIVPRPVSWLLLLIPVAVVIEHVGGGEDAAHRSAAWSMARGAGTLVAPPRGGVDE